MSEFQPTHTLSITVDGLTLPQPVAVVNASWELCEPGPGALLVTVEEWAAEGGVSFSLDDEQRLCCNNDPHGWGVGSWELKPLDETAALEPGSTRHKFEVRGVAFSNRKRARVRSAARPRYAFEGFGLGDRKAARGRDLCVEQRGSRVRLQGRARPSRDSIAFTASKKIDRAAFDFLGQ